MSARNHAIAAVVVLALIGAGAWLWQFGPLGTQAPVVVAPKQPVVPAQGPALEATAASGPAVKHKIEMPVSPPPLAAPVDLETALAGLFGRKAVLSLFQLDDFPRRFVATVDNLGRTHAPSASWPVNPTAGRFLVDRQGAGESISADNSLRYTSYVLLLETVDLPQTVALYVQRYPQFQQAYQDIGFPNGYFNDRLVEVIDLLLATPAPKEPLKVHRPVINGPIQPERPWVLYEFDAPALQALSAGQKTLLRMGAVNQRRVKLKLAELRRLVTAGSAPR